MQRWAVLHEHDESDRVSGLKNARGSSLARISMLGGVAGCIVMFMWLVETVCIHTKAKANYGRGNLACQVVGGKVGIFHGVGASLFAGWLAHVAFARLAGAAKNQ